MAAAGEMLNKDQKVTNKTNKLTLKDLKDYCKRLVDKLTKACCMLANHHFKVKVIRTSKTNDQDSIETKTFNVLKDIDVELSSYHGGSIHGKDIKR
jgi:hypothetical protein